jgi:hypothetical protein
MKIHSVGAKLFHADGQTGRNGETKSRFSQLSQRAYEPRERDVTKPVTATCRSTWQNNYIYSHIL